MNRKGISRAVHPDKYRWRVLLPCGGILDVAANTKSEARGRAKPLAGLRRRDRLPVGTCVERLTP